MVPLGLTLKPLLHIGSSPPVPSPGCPHALSPLSTSWRGGTTGGCATDVEGTVRRCDSPHNTSVSNSLAAGPIADIFSAARSQLPALERRETGCWVVVAQPAVLQSWVPVGRQPG